MLRIELSNNALSSILNIYIYICAIFMQVKIQNISSTRGASPRGRPRAFAHPHFWAGTAVFSLGPTSLQGRGHRSTFPGKECNWNSGNSNTPLSPPPEITTGTSTD